MPINPTIVSIKIILIVAEILIIIIMVIVITIIIIIVITIIIIIIIITITLIVIIPDILLSTIVNIQSPRRILCTTSEQFKKNSNSFCNKTNNNYENNNS